MRRFKFNIAVRPWFWFVAATMLLMLPIGWIFGWLVAVLFHESGHVIALLSLRKPINEIVLDHKGIYIKTDSMLPWEEILCAVSGPVVGLCPLMVSRYFPQGAVCAWGLSFFNMLPVYPMDGGRVLLGIMSMIFDPLEASNVCCNIGTAALTVLLAITIIFAMMNHIFLPLVLLVMVLLLKNIREKYLANKRN